MTMVYIKYTHAFVISIYPDVQFHGEKSQLSDKSYTMCVMFQSFARVSRDSWKQCRTDRESRTGLRRAGPVLLLRMTTYLHCKE